MKASAHAQDQNQGQPAYTRQAFQILSSSLLGAYKLIEKFTLLRLSVNEVFNTIKDQTWTMRPRPIPYDPSLPKVKEYCSYHDGKGHKTIHCRSL